MDGVCEVTLEVCKATLQDALKGRVLRRKGRLRHISDAGAVTRSPSRVTRRHFSFLSLSLSVSVSLVLPATILSTTCLEIRLQDQHVRHPRGTLVRFFMSPF